MPAQVYQVLGLYLVTTVAYITWVFKANRDMDKKNAKS
jgi:hypothetical protein